MKVSWKCHQEQRIKINVIKKTTVWSCGVVGRRCSSLESIYTARIWPLTSLWKPNLSISVLQGELQVSGAALSVCNQSNRGGWRSSPEGYWNEKDLKSLLGAFRRDGEPWSETIYGDLTLWWVLKVKEAVPFKAWRGQRSAFREQPPLVSGTKSWNKGNVRRLRMRTV